MSRFVGTGIPLDMKVDITTMFTSLTASLDVTASTANAPAFTELQEAICSYINAAVTKMWEPAIKKHSEAAAVVELSLPLPSPPSPSSCTI